MPAEGATSLLECQVNAMLDPTRLYATYIVHPTFHPRKEDAKYKGLKLHAVPIVSLLLFVAASRAVPRVFSVINVQMALLRYSIFQNTSRSIGLVSCR